jgi:hypothetical protein
MNCHPGQRSEAKREPGPIAKFPGGCRVGAGLVAAVPGMTRFG